MTAHAPPKPTMTRDEVAEAAGVHPRTLGVWARRGYGPRPVRLGPRTLRYRRADVETWLARGDTPAAPGDG